MGDDPTSQATPSGEGPSGRPLPLSVRLLGAGVRGARTVGKATGIDRAVQVAAEEAMVAAVESEAGLTPCDDRRARDGGRRASPERRDDGPLEKRGDAGACKRGGGGSILGRPMR